jgi:hypothetical protein
MNPSFLKSSSTALKLALLLGAITVTPCHAEETLPGTQTSGNEEWNLYGQTTFIRQEHPAFSAKYTGVNSLTPDRDLCYTLTNTAFIGKRGWQNGEIYLNIEELQARPFTESLVGFGTVANGEVTRSAGSAPAFYVPRFFLRQTLNLGGDAKLVESGANQLAGTVQANRVVLTAGKFSTLDIFDGNAYAKDPRTQFFNAANMASGAYDYASDARGYGWGLAIEWYQDAWELRLSRMTGPTEPNGFFSDLNIGQHYGDQFEIVHAHNLGAQPGKIRVLGWRNRAQLATFQDALAWLKAHPGQYSGPDALYATRYTEQVKFGLGINIEQAVSEDAGLFLRVMFGDGKAETHAYTEVDRSLATGISLKGANWGRSADTIGFALIYNTISDDRRRFLEAGGISFFIGDGALNYQPERILESYYSLNVLKKMWLSLDYQHITNPAYNADRGPVQIYGARLHLEY